MKKTIVIVLILMVVFSCEKQPFDYRNKFVGNYEFHEVKLHGFNFPIAFTQTDTTYSVNMKATIERGEEFNQINIIFTTPTEAIEDIFNISVSHDGKITFFANPPNSIIGKIETKNIELTTTYGGLGSRVTTIYIGKKK